MSQTNSIAVRSLVEFMLKKGHIDNRITRLDNTAALGTRLQRQIQKEMGPEYEKEVALSITLPLSTGALIVSGRADGLIRTDAGVTIDEIKAGQWRFTDLPSEQLELYWAQVMCYGYILCQGEELATITLQLTYIEMESETITRQERSFTQRDLTDFFEQLIQDYTVWLDFQAQWRAHRDTSLQELAFPFESYRQGQRELAVATYKTILAEKKLYVEAPTGTGKTISTLFPALKSLGTGQSDKLFYLTAKTSTQQVAEETIEQLATAGAELKSVTLTAKDKICFMEQRICTPEHCPFANGYYDRLNPGLLDLLEQENQLTRPVIEKYAQKHQLCPFELSLDASLWCDTIICDYNYLFDPIIYLRRFFQSEQADYVFLIDESHNLVARSKEMYSSELKRRDFAALLEQLPPEAQMLEAALTQVIAVFDEIAAAIQPAAFSHQAEPYEKIFEPLVKLSEAVQVWLPQNLQSSMEQEVLSLYFSVSHYLKISELYDDRYVTYMLSEGYENTIKQMCLDPSFLLAQRLEKSKASVLFSASLSPLFYYADVLGGGEEALTYQLPSPFRPENQLILVAAYLQTTYQKRNQSRTALVQTLAAMLQSKMGNYMVFFPSYAYLEAVLAEFKETYPSIQTLVQGRTMAEPEREAFLAHFDAQPQDSLLAFCVLGGIFSEGINLKGERLSGVAIVGVGLPQINHEQELLKDYYDEKQQAGFAYAYQIPGMNKVLQAAGRVIRDTKDVGVVLLLDQRFASQQYQRFFPPHWQHRQILYSQTQLARELQTFWDNNNQ